MRSRVAHGLWWRTTRRRIQGVDLALRAERGGIRLQADTKSFAVEKRLSNTTLDGRGGCNVREGCLDGRVSGGDGEIGEGQAIHSVPHALSLRTGAVLSGTDGDPILALYNSLTGFPAGALRVAGC